MGKSFLATQLAERINVPNVLQTNLVYEFLNSVKYTTPHTPPILTLSLSHSHLRIAHALGFPFI